MGYMLLTYEIDGRTVPGQLVLDFIGQRWSRRKVAHAIVRHEFPSLCPDQMRGEEWSAEQVLERFGINNIRYEFAQSGSTPGATKNGSAKDHVHMLKL